MSPGAGASARNQLNMQGMALSVVCFIMGILIAQSMGGCGSSSPSRVVVRQMVVSPAAAAAADGSRQQQQQQQRPKEPDPGARDQMTDAKEPRVSWHRCIGADGYTCLLYNVCYDGERLLYVAGADRQLQQSWRSFPTQPPLKDVPTPLLHLSGRREERSLLTLHAAAEWPESYSYSRGSHALIMLHGMANAGHAILENGMPLVHNLVLLGEDVQSTRVLMRRSCKTPDDFWTTGDPFPEPAALPRCEENLDNWLQPLSRHPLLTMDEQFAALRGGAEHPVCFERLLVGMGETGFHANPVNQRGMAFRLYRDEVWRRKGLTPKVSCERLSVVVHNKIGRRNISNIAEVAEAIRGMGAFRGFPVDVRLLTMDDLGHEELLRLSAGTDVFVSCGGSALFNGIMMRDGAVVVGTALFSNVGDIMDYEFRDLLHNIPQARFLEMAISRGDMDLSGHLTVKVDLASVPMYLREALQYSVEFKSMYHGCPPNGPAGA